MCLLFIREEWGNPNEERFYEYMASYSPYDNVTSHTYPAMLVTAGLNDPRVAYWEPAKWVAKIREHKPGDDVNPLLLKTDMSSGHCELWFWLSVCVCACVSE